MDKSRYSQMMWSRWLTPNLADGGTSIYISGGEIRVTIRPQQCSAPLGYALPYSQTGKKLRKRKNTGKCCTVKLLPNLHRKVTTTASLSTWERYQCPPQRAAAMTTGTSSLMTISVAFHNESHCTWKKDKGVHTPSAP